MRKTTIDKLCDRINELGGATYPMCGYLYYANIKGDGRRHRTVYCIINENGGVAAAYNGPTPRHTAARLRELITALEAR